VNTTSSTITTDVNTKLSSKQDKITAGDGLIFDANTLKTRYRPGFGLTFETSGNNIDINSVWKTTTVNKICNHNNAFVGINKNEPVFALDVVGDLNITGKYLVNGADTANLWVNGVATDGIFNPLSSTPLQVVGKTASFFPSYTTQNDKRVGVGIGTHSPRADLHIYTPSPQEYVSSLFKMSSEWSGSDFYDGFNIKFEQANLSAEIFLGAGANGGSGPLRIYTAGKADQITLLDNPNRTVRIGNPSVFTPTGNQNFKLYCGGKFYAEKVFAFNDISLCRNEDPNSIANQTLFIGDNGTHRIIQSLGVDDGAGNDIPLAINPFTKTDGNIRNYVGIGKTDPLHALDVNGKINAGAFLIGNVVQSFTRQTRSALIEAPDEVEDINTTSNLINNTGFAGYVYYQDADEDSIAKVKAISYTELTNVPTAFPPSSHTHTMQDISGLDTEFTNTSNYVRFESNVLRGLINTKQDILTAGANISIVNNVISATGGGGDSLWTDNTSYISYNNIQVYPSEIRINNPAGVVIDSYLHYEFKSLALLPVDSSPNARSLTITGAEYALDSSRNSILLGNGDVATFANANWSTFTDLSISGWFKTGSSANNDELIDFLYTETTQQVVPTPFFNTTTDMIAWYRFENNLVDSSGNNRALTSTGTFSYVAGKVGTNSIRQASASSTSFLTNPNVNVCTSSSDQAFTVSFWIRFTTLTGTTLYRLIEFGNVASNNRILSINWSGSGVRFAFFGTQLDVAYASSIFLNEWVHLTFTYANRVQTIYKDGMPVGTRQHGSNPIIDPGHFRVGYTVRGGTTIHSFIGDMDDLRIYNRALTQSEININSHTIYMYKYTCICIYHI
jgi:hypothetical protein